eukprot:13615894-Ditylum_brightwellii.AAC.1
MMFLMICSRPDLAYLMHCLSKGMASPTEQLMKLAERGLAYIRRTQDWGLYFSGSTPLTGY